jgi:hypothetical protein
MRAVGLLLTLLFVLLGVGMHEARAMPPNIWREFGNEHGLTDLKGKEIVRPNYAEISYLGSGLFLLRPRGIGGRFTRSVLSVLINRKGTALNPIVPEGATFEDLFRLGEQSDSDSGPALDQLPKDALLRFRLGEHLGVCDQKGTVILPANFTYISHPKDGCAILRRFDDHLSFLMRKPECNGRFSAKT